MLSTLTQCGTAFAPLRRDRLRRWPCRDRRSTPDPRSARLRHPNLVCACRRESFGVVAEARRSTGQVLSAPLFEPLTPSLREEVESGAKRATSHAPPISSEESDTRVPHWSSDAPC